MVWVFQLLLNYFKRMMSVEAQRLETELPAVDRTLVDPIELAKCKRSKEPHCTTSDQANAVTQSAAAGVGSATTASTEQPPPLKTDVVETGAGSDAASTNSLSHCTAHSSRGSSSGGSVRAAAGITTSGSKTAGKSKPSGERSVGSGGGTDSAVTSLDPDTLDVLRFRTKFLQTVEELKMRRESELSKESRIKELVEEKHELQQKCDDVESVYVQHLEQCSHQEEEIRKQFNTQIRQFEEDKARQACLEEARHKEIKALKDEIRALQLSKYNLEKKVEDQERQLQVQTKARESVLSEMSGVESKYQTVLAQVCSTTEQLAHLEANVQEAVEMNRKLRYINEHQKCVLVGREAELEAARQELLEARVCVADRLTERGERERLGVRNSTAHELKMTRELNKQLQSQLSGVREEHQAVLAQLKQAHTLLDKHIETCNKAQESEKTLREEVEKSRSEGEGLERDVAGLKDQLTTQRQEWSTGIEEWKTKGAEVEQRLRSLQQDYSDLQNSRDQLETEGEEREGRLKAEMESLGREREEREERAREGEQNVRELHEKVRELEKSLRTAESEPEGNKTFQDKEVQVSSPKTPLQLKTVSANSLRAPVVVRQTPPPNKTATSGTSVAGRDDSEQSTHEVMVGVTSGGGVVPSPPHSHFQSPEVISISDASPASATKPPVMALPSPRLHLASPRLHLERVYLPPKIEDGSIEESLSRKGSSEVSLKRRIEQQHQTTSTDTNSPANKKYKTQFQRGTHSTARTTNRSTTGSVAVPMEAELSEEGLQDPFSLSQPLATTSSHGSSRRNNTHDERQCQSLSQSTGSSRYKKGKSVEAWRVNFHHPTRNSVKSETSTRNSAGSETPPPATETRDEGKGCEVPGGLPQQKNAPHKPHHKTNTDRKQTESTVVKMESLSPTAPPNTQRKTHTSATAESSADQSVPNSPGGGSNFAIVFSEGEEEEGEEEGGRCGNDELLNSQMNRQIKKVTTFLKVDRLRRTKVPKL